MLLEAFVSNKCSNYSSFLKFFESGHLPRCGFKMADDVITNLFFINFIATFSTKLIKNGQMTEGNTNHPIPKRNLGFKVSLPRNLSENRNFFNFRFRTGKVAELWAPRIAATPLAAAKPRALELNPLSRQEAVQGSMHGSVL